MERDVEGAVWRPVCFGSDPLPYRISGKAMVSRTQAYMWYSQICLCYFVAIKGRCAIYYKDRRFWDIL